MKSSDEFKVQPVRRYRTPKYPSHLDPDPTLHPDPVPYPISGKAVSALASASLVLTTACQPPVQSTTSETQASEAQNPEALDSMESHKSDFDEGSDMLPNFRQRLYQYEEELGVDREKEIAHAFDHLFDDEDYQTPDEVRELALRKMLIDEAGGNPLCVAVSGLPHQTSPFGTGVPNRVDGDAARIIIERVFAKAGYNMLPNVRYDKDGVAFVVDGYDAEKKVGFVVTDWRNLDNDALVSWLSESEKLRDKDPFVKIEALSALALQNIMYTNDPEKPKYVADIVAAKRIADPAKAVAALNAILVRMSKKLLSLKEIQSLEQTAIEGKQFIAVISTFDERFQIPWSYKVPEEDVTALDGQIQKKMTKLADADEDVHSEEHVNQIEMHYTKQMAKLEARSVMQSLETAAREYIEWAKTQGLE